MEPTLTLEMHLGVSPALLAFAGMLALSSAELEDLVERELSANPALDRAGTPPCPLCGSRENAACCAAGRSAQSSVTRRSAAETAGAPLPQPEWAAPVTGAEQLLEEVRWSCATAADADLAGYLIASLDDHGFLRDGAEQIATDLGIDPARVVRSLELIRGVGPPAIGARDVRESLLLQLGARCAPSPLRELARALADQYLELLGRGRLSAIAAALGCAEDEVTAAIQFIRAQCTLYPAPGLREPRTASRAPAVPDVVISAGRNGTDELHVELMEPARLALRIDPGYGQLAAQLSLSGHDGQLTADDRDLRAHVTELVRQASWFIARLDERFRTIRRVVEYAANRQRGFVLGGAKYLRPLAQADAARDLGIHESTVSRAVAGKYMMMPSRAVVPVQDFFRAGLAPQEALRQLIATEDHPLSDAELAQRLSAQGFSVARRTVAKYRDRLGLAAGPVRRALPPAAKLSSRQGR
jgi:RNA polymerase sigma-54 factor